jgi:hypothetical protein
MTEFDPTTDRDPARPECAAGQAALQRLLDGDANWDSPEAAAHRAECIACREELALAGVIGRSTNVVVPAELTDRVLKTAVSAHRRRRALRYAGAGLALAASIVIAVVKFQPTQTVESVPGPVAVAPKVDRQIADGPTKPLGESVSEARDAIVSLANRTATETRDQSTRLMPTPKMPEPPAGDDRLEPLAEARTGAARSVEPIRDSARRAINFFARAAEPSQRR